MESNTKDERNQLWFHKSNCPSWRVLLQLLIIKTPTSIQEALKDENWIQAMNEKTKELKKKLNLGDFAKGYIKTYRIDYEQTFFLVAKMNMLKIPYFMEIPLGFYSYDEKNKVCRLKKALHGLQ
ncbi:hypothetical protein CR513_32103, partial [Mucuna pruriens]